MRHALLVLIATALAEAFAAPAAGGEVNPWRPKGISSPQFESHAAFDPVTGDLYFVRSSPTFEGWRILVSRCGPQGWREPQPPAFAGDGRGSARAESWRARLEGTTLETHTSGRAVSFHEMRSEHISSRPISGIQAG